MWFQRTGISGQWSLVFQNGWSGGTGNMTSWALTFEPRATMPNFAGVTTYHWHLDHAQQHRYRVNCRSISVLHGTWKCWSSTGAPFYAGCNVTTVFHRHKLAIHCLDGLRRQVH
ncbi:MAG: hypothetical protein IPQ02_18485 [Saprospiraceae bacterium]|nr:hypothetical protein [Candidatus Defluviibacterium haderslevense]